MIFGDHRLEMKKLPLFFGIPDDLISFLGCLELGKISTDSHSQDEKHQRRRVHLEKTPYESASPPPPKTSFNPQFCANLFCFLEKNPLENPFGFEHPSKTTPGTGALGLSRGVTFVVDESSKGIIQSLFQ